MVNGISVRVLLVLRTGSNDLWASFILIFLKVLGEIDSEVFQCGCILLLVSPSVNWHKNLWVNSWAGCWDVKTEDIELLRWCSLELSAMDSIDDCSCDFKVHSLSDAVFTTTPASVDQPSMGSVLLHFISKHLSIDNRMKRQEGFSEASREGHLWLFNADFGTSNFSGVSGDEMIHGLFVGQFRHWRKDTEGIAGKEDDILWMTTISWNLGTRDEM
mmetsp:Transcript_67787/g.78764  ORF Transcript_67787/g.78764 Transcript_67787/m.78764 type:complete len:216 (+) Transcript_67787:154-801(+)